MRRASSTKFLSKGEASRVSGDPPACLAGSRMPNLSPLYDAEIRLTIRLNATHCG